MRRQRGRAHLGGVQRVAAGADVLAKLGGGLPLGAAVVGDEEAPPRLEHAEETAGGGASRGGRGQGGGQRGRGWGGRSVPHVRGRGCGPAAWTASPTHRANSAGLSWMWTIVSRLTTASNDCSGKSRLVMSLTSNDTCNSVRCVYVPACARGRPSLVGHARLDGGAAHGRGGAAAAALSAHPPRPPPTLTFSPLPAAAMRSSAVSTMLTDRSTPYT